MSYELMMYKKVMDDALSKKYKSKLEIRVADVLGETWEYEPGRYEYTITKKYIPDFVRPNSCGYPEWIEVKGYFRPGDTQKYKAIREYYPDHRLIFVFDKPFNKVRKGAKITMAQWAEKNGWEWTTPQAIEEEGI